LVYMHLTWWQLRCTYLKASGGMPGVTIQARMALSACDARLYMRMVR